MRLSREMHEYQRLLSADITVTEITMVMEQLLDNYRKDSLLPPRYANCICLVVTGAAEYASDAFRVRVSAGELLVLRKDDLYTGRQLGDVPYSILFADFQTSKPLEEEPFPPFRRFELSHPEVVKNYFMNLLRAWQYKRLGYLIQCRSILNEIFLYVLRDYASTVASVRVLEQVADAARYMESGFRDPQTRVMSLADMSYMSQAQFRRVFKQAYGVSPIQYLTNLRISSAKSMMRESSFSLSYIADMCGFSSVYYFSRVFKQVVGVPPSEYMKHS